jgi:hypothetical protein
MSTLTIQQSNLTDSPKKVKFNEIEDVKIVVIDMKHMHRHKLTAEHIRQMRNELEDGCCVLM